MSGVVHLFPQILQPRVQLQPHVGEVCTSIPCNRLRSTVEAVHVAIGAVVAATAPALPATLPANTSLNYMQPNFELRRSATTFTPGAEVHRTPIKATSAAAAAASEDEEHALHVAAAEG